MILVSTWNFTCFIVNCHITAKYTTTQFIKIKKKVFPIVLIFFMVIHCTNKKISFNVLGGLWFSNYFRGFIYVLNIPWQLRASSFYFWVRIVHLEHTMQQDHLWKSWKKRKRVGLTMSLVCKYWHCHGKGRRKKGWWKKINQEGTTGQHLCCKGTKTRRISPPRHTEVVVYPYQKKGCFRTPLKST